MYRNITQLMTCSSCHDSHGSDLVPHDLRQSASDNSLCTACHSTAAFTTVRPHVAMTTTPIHDSAPVGQFVCTTCHMVGTATLGAGNPALRDTDPSSAQPVQHRHGEIAGHRFNETRRAAITSQPVAFTSACASCHQLFLPNP